MNSILFTGPGGCVCACVCLCECVCVCVHVRVRVVKQCNRISVVLWALVQSRE